MARETLSILGATGSVGSSTLAIVEQQIERFDIVALTAQNNATQLADLCRRFKPQFAAIGNTAQFPKLKEALQGVDIELAAGAEGLIEAATRPAARIMAAISGFAGLAPSLASVKQGSIVMLANKECLVSAGALFMATAAQAKCRMLPVDSEHNAIYQILDGRNFSDIKRLILTASGGPFRHFTQAELAKVTASMATKHPIWPMGAKISIDSATLMNKGLELIEAQYLFAQPPDCLDVLVHPQSIIHGLVYLHDGAVLAQMATPDMRIPIAYCLGWPHRLPTDCAPLNLEQIGKLEFEAPDIARFPCLQLAKTAMQLGGGAPTILNAANEIAVAAFQAEKIGFMQIPALVETVLDNSAQLIGTSNKGLDNIEQVLALDSEARRIAEEEVAKFG